MIGDGLEEQIPCGMGHYHSFARHWQVGWHLSTSVEMVNSIPYIAF